MSQRDNIISLDRSGVTNGQSKSVQENRAIIDSCRQAVARGLDLLGESFFEKLDDALYKFADKAESNDLQTRYFEAMREVRKLRAGIEKSFQSNILTGYDSFWGQSSEPVAVQDDGEVDFDNLELIETDTLEEELAINNMVARGESACLRELYALEQRFSKILDGKPVESKTNPLSPDKICNSFRAAVKVLDIDIPAKLVVYKVFEQQVVSHLDEVYAGINELLRDAGIIPKLRPKIRRSKVTAATYGRMSGSAPGDEQVPGSYEGVLAPETDEVTLELFDTLRSLLVNIQTPPANRVFEPGTPRAETNQVVSALSSLQHDDAISRSYDASNGNHGYVDLKANLLRELRRVANNPSVGSVKQVDDDTIDMVSMLFEFILGDPNIPDVMKVLLAQLQIPIVKVAILDKDFFSKTSHPARRLLNNLSHAVVGWSGDKDKNSGLYVKVDSIVRRILSDFQEDVRLYVELNEDLEKFMQQEHRGSEAAEKRTTQIARGKEQLGVAKRRVKREIDQRIKRQGELPLAVINLLNEGWKDVLMLHFLRRGAKSKEWQEALAVMDRLIWTVEPKSDLKEREKMLREIPSILGVMRREMSDILCDQHLMSRLFADLERVHLGCLQGQEVPQEMIADSDKIDEMLDSLEPDAENGSKDKKAVVTPDSEKYHDLAKSLALGCWLEIREKDGTKSRVKLSWRSGVSDNYLFVNRKGVKDREMTQSELALALQVGEAIVISGVDSPLMDRAFAAMMASLKGTGNSEPEPA